MRDLYAEVTNRIIAALEAGTPPWIRPWTGKFDRFPTNAASGRPYRGINSLLLTLEAQASGYARNRWLTYRQAQEIGAQVRGGERGTPVIFFKLLDMARTREEPSAPVRAFPMLRSFTVFNIAQVDGLPPRLQTPIVDESSWLPSYMPENVLKESCARIQHGGVKAFYNVDADFIQLPERGRFPSSSGYYATALHELVHWTGHHSRLDRRLGRRFGEAAYAMEELIAEIGSAFLCAACHVPGELRHASYVANWVQVLQNDKRAVFSAAASAQKAADFLGALARPKAVPMDELAEAA